MAEPFLVVGAMKSGTTTLHELLSRHPEVDLVADKESNALAEPRLRDDFVRAVRDSSRRVAGEVTAGYMQAPRMEQPLAAARALGDGLKVVAILREPFRRAASHWEQWSQLEWEGRTLEEALLEPSGPYVAFSRYAAQLDPWADLVGTERCLVLRLEDYEADPAAVAQQLWDFLGVAPLPADQVEVHANAGTRRVVARGALGRVSRSGLYRRAIRPVLTPGVRRRLVSVAGGGRGRVTAVADDRVREAFRELVAADLARLGSRWPGATW